jgi:hypothetical protein
MSEVIFKEGTILENEIRQFTKVISFKNGVYALSGWMTRENAMKSTVAKVFLNIYGARHANLRAVRVASKDKESTTTKSEVTTSSVSSNGSKTTKYSKADLKKLDAKGLKALAEKLKLDSKGKRADVEKRILAI